MLAIGLSEPLLALGLAVAAPPLPVTAQETPHVLEAASRNLEWCEDFYAVIEGTVSQSGFNEDASRSFVATWLRSPRLERVSNGRGFGKNADLGLVPPGLHRADSILTAKRWLEVTWKADGEISHAFFTEDEEMIAQWREALLSNSTHAGPLFQRSPADRGNVLDLLALAETLEVTRFSSDAEPAIVVNGAGSFGTLEVIVRPNKNFVVSEWTLQKSPESTYGRFTLKDAQFAEWTAHYCASEFENIGGFVVPTKATFVVSSTSGPTSGTIEYAFEVTQIEVPAPEQFVTDELPIPNGTPVNKHGGERATQSGLRYEWRDGEVLPRSDPDILALIEHIASGSPLGSFPLAVDPELDCSLSVPYCGLYATYAALRINGRMIPFEAMLDSSYIGHRDGSSIAELCRALEDQGAHPQVFQKMSIFAGTELPPGTIFYVKGHDVSIEPDHFVTCVANTGDGIRIFDPAAGLVEWSLPKLRERWKGTVILLDDQQAAGAVRRAALLELAFFSLALVPLGLVVLSCRSSRVRMLAERLGNAQRALVIIVLATVTALLFHLLNPVGVLRNVGILDRLQSAHAGVLLDEISPRELEHLMSRQDIVVIDARYPAAFEAGHFEGAINIPPYADDNARRMALAAIDSRRHLIIYCETDTCQFARLVAARLRYDGWRHLSILRGGWAEWERYCAVQSGQKP